MGGSSSSGPSAHVFTASVQDVAASLRVGAAASPRFSPAASLRVGAAASPRFSAAASPRVSAAASPRVSAAASPRVSAAASPCVSTAASPGFSAAALSEEGAVSRRSDRRVAAFCLVSSEFSFRHGVPRGTTAKAAVCEVSGGKRARYLSTSCVVSGSRLTGKTPPSDVLERWW